MAAAMIACAAASVSANDGAPLGVVPLSAAALPSVEVGADVAEAMLALLSVVSMGLAARAASPEDATGTRAAAADTLAEVADKIVEGGAAVGTSSEPSAGVRENPGGMARPATAWPPASS